MYILPMADQCPHVFAADIMLRLHNVGMPTSILNFCQLNFCEISDVKVQERLRLDVNALFEG